MFTGYSDIPRALLPRPGYLQPISENGFKNTIIRICDDATAGGLPNEGAVKPIPSPIGGVWKGDWSRARYSKRQSWNADGSLILIDQKYGGAPERIVISNSTLRPVWGSLINGAAAPTGSRSRKLADAREVQWRPGYPTQMVSMKRITSPLVGLQVEVFDTNTGATMAPIINIPCEPWTMTQCNLGWIGEGTISDNGRWTAFCTELTEPQLDAAKQDFIVLVNLDTGQIGARTYVHAATNLYPNANHGEIGHCSVSAQAHFVSLKLKGSNNTTDASGTYAAQPSFVYYADFPGIMPPQVMAADGLRMPNAAAWADTTSGLIAYMSHASMNIDSAGKDVIVGAVREMDFSNAPVPPLGSGSDAQKRARIPGAYGYLISVDLATGRYVHVSPGKTQVGREIAGVQHTSGVNYRRRGWHCITTDVENLGRWGSSELQMCYLNAANTTTGSRKIERWCRLHTDDTSGGHSGSAPSGYDGGTAAKYNSEAHGSFNPLGTVGIFASNWMIDANPTSSKGPFDNKGYIVKNGSTTAISGDNFTSGGVTTIWPL